MKCYAIVDIETTGASPSHDRIIEIAIIRVEDGKIVKTYEQLINPERPLYPSIEAITGINHEELWDAPVFAEVAHTIREMLEGAIFVAHNVRFDYGFIKNEFKRLEQSYKAKCLCTVRLSRKLYPTYKHHDLTSIIDRYHFVCEKRHRAFSDAKVLWDFLGIASKEKKFDEAVKVLLGGQTLPQHLDPSAIKQLPEGPGVYIFYGSEGEVLYVGKSINIKQRVLSHFSNDYTAGREMNICQQAHSIEARETAGELGALLLESELIKKLYPLYNRASRKKKKIVIMRRVEDIKGYYTVTIERVDSIPTEDHESVLSVFKSTAQAKKFLAQACLEQKLCQKIMGLEKSGRQCFHYQLGKCHGACCDEEHSAAYNARFEQAFKERKIRAWPYKQPIIIEEKKLDVVGEGESFVIYNWCLIGNTTYDEGGNNADIRTTNRTFDYDNYKILARYLLNKKNKKNIRLLDNHQTEHYVVY